MELPLYEKIYLDLLNQIETEQLKPGDQLPTEKELASQYGVSRITSKKAVEKLVQIGAIERIRGKGSYVSDRLPDVSAFRKKSSSAPSEFPEDEPNGLIALIIPDFFKDSFGRKIMKNIEKRCAEKNYSLVVKLTYGSQEEEDEAINTMVQLGVKGIMIYPVNGQHYTASILRLVLEGFPLVLIDRYLKGIPVCSVYTDNKKAAQNLTEFLLTQGHDHIAFVSPPEEDTSSIEERIQGFQAAYLQRGIAVSPDLLVTEMFSTLPTFEKSDEFQEDLIKLRKFIEENAHVTAFIACEYEIACVLAHVLKSLGNSIPADYAIACFDHPGWFYNDMIFTHIKQDEAGIAVKSVDLLLKQINGETVPVKNMVEFKLVEGNTV
ncbi:GntR family transcriptional regulator [Peribacillus kribbensis]|uniref:GntR family transcriptional regulator n=1 Tax=Peribacillus kribbensis TaxID=356658 RepID=UPI0003F6FDCA|nr:LacI family DNA-binding transcriptional regulator [Peribacillus kribbensis]